MRYKGLDILRGISVVLVIARHSNLNFLLTKFAWLGVDLFFVLSGFLISSILFQEYKIKGKIDVKRFLVRRALKIFPPYYFFVLVSVLIMLFCQNTTIIFSRLLAEIFYVQNYFPRIWLHTWSLALEEHFYLVFAFLMFFVSKGTIKSTKKITILIFVSLLIISFFLRLQTSLPHKNDVFYGFFETHLRLDGILVGVFLSFLYHFTKYTDYLLKYKYIGISLCFLLILPGFLFLGGSFFMNTFGLSFVNLGFGLLLFYTLKIDFQKIKRNWIDYPLNLIAFIGINSYSIYLWHLNSKTFVYSIFHFNEKTMTIIYTCSALIFGILMSYSVEKVFIKIRDKKFS